jgi:hypothetical protein
MDPPVGHQGALDSTVRGVPGQVLKRCILPIAASHQQDCARGVAVGEAGEIAANGLQCARTGIKPWAATRAARRGSSLPSKAHRAAANAAEGVSANSGCPGIRCSGAATTFLKRRFCKCVWENIHEDSSNERHCRRCWHKSVLCFLCFCTEYRDAAAKPTATGCPGSSPGTAGHDASGWRAG